MHGVAFQLDKGMEIVSHNCFSFFFGIIINNSLRFLDVKIMHRESYFIAINLVTKRYDTQNASKPFKSEISSSPIYRVPSHRSWTREKNK